MNSIPINNNTNMKKFRILTLLLFAAIFAALLLTSCGEDTTTSGNNGTPSTLPNINMKVGSVYTFTVDSIQTNGSITPTRIKTIHTYLSQGTFFDSSNVFQVRVLTEDSVTHIPIAQDTFYVRYESGKFYQYGVIQMLDPSITATWDLIADFNVSQGTQWTIASNVTIHLGSTTFTANIKSKVAADTSFSTYGWGNVNVHSYRAEVTADIFLGGTPIGTVYVDYFIGDDNPPSNPPGLVRLRLRPVSFLGFYNAAGADQKMQHWSIP